MSYLNTTSSTSNYSYMLKVCTTATVLFVFIACNTGKKLTTANTQIDSLKIANALLLEEKQKLADTINTAKELTKIVAGAFDRYKEDCEAAKEKLKIGRNILMAEHNKMIGLKKRIQNALENFREKGVDVYFENGLVYVSLGDNLLFSSGSSVLSEKGKKSLSPVANILKDYPDLNLFIQGGTDDIPYKNSSGNWRLSTERANSVVHVLINTYKINPNRLTAVGKSEYDPIGTNLTVEGRARNRRIDIILNPNLEKLWRTVNE